MGVNNMRRIIEKIYRVGSVSETTRITTEDCPTPWYWRLAVGAALFELGGTMALMAAILVLAVAKRHGWIA
jgi:hypothetical protein